MGRALFVGPKRLNRIGIPLEIIPLGTPLPYPIAIWVQQPVFLLTAFRSVLDERDVDDIHPLGVAAILILALVLGNLLVLPDADRPDPTRDAIARNFLAGDAATTDLSRICKTHETASLQSYSKPVYFPTASRIGVAVACNNVNCASILPVRQHPDRHFGPVTPHRHDYRTRHRPGSRVRSMRASSPNCCKRPRRNRSNP